MNLLIYITAPDKESAVDLSRRLVEAGLAAGANIAGPVHSIYHWLGSVKEKEEWQIFLQAPQDKFSQLEDLISSLHPYQVPCVIGLPIQNGNKAFMDWIASGGRLPCAWR